MQPSDLQKIIEDLLDKLKLPGLKTYSFYFAIATYLIGVLLIFLISREFKRIRASRNQRSVHEDLFPAFDERDVKEYTQIFIATRYQFSSPTKDNTADVTEIDDFRIFSFFNSERRNLIKFLITKSLKRPRKHSENGLFKLFYTLQRISLNVSAMQKAQLIDKRFIMVIADTGVGKTAFMVNPYSVTFVGKNAIKTLSYYPSQWKDWING